jgi:hypothetical protein
VPLKVADGCFLRVKKQQKFEGGETCGADGVGFRTRVAGKVMMGWNDLEESPGI